MTLTRLIQRLQAMEAEHGGKRVALGDWNEECAYPMLEWDEIEVCPVPYLDGQDLVREEVVVLGRHGYDIPSKFINECERQRFLGRWKT